MINDDPIIDSIAFTRAMIVHEQVSTIEREREKESDHLDTDT